jgi:hypothetical protein
MRKLAFLMALVLTLGVAGMASALPVRILDGTEVNALNKGPGVAAQPNIDDLDDHGMLIVDGTTAGGGQLQLTPAGWTNLVAIMDAWSPVVFVAPAAHNKLTLLLANRQVDVPAGALRGNSRVERFIANEQLRTMGNEAFAAITGTDNHIEMNMITATGMATLGSSAFAGSRLQIAGNATVITPANILAAEAAISLPAGTTLNNIPLVLFNGAGNIPVGTVPFNFPPFLTRLTDRVFWGSAWVDPFIGGSAADLRSATALQTIDGSAFQTSTITTVMFPASLRTIGDHAFAGILNLGMIGWNAGLDTIKDFAFEDSSIAPNQQLPISLRVIGDNAFNGAIGLTGISWAAGANAMLETIGESAFVGTGLQNFNPAWIGGPAANPARLINLKTIGKNAFLDVESLVGTVNFEFSPIEKIAEGAFKNTNVTRVDFNETLQELADEAFYNTGMVSISFLNGYTGDEPATADEYFALFPTLGKKVFGRANFAVDVTSFYDRGTKDLNIYAACSKYYLTGNTDDEGSVDMIWLLNKNFGFSSDTIERRTDWGQWQVRSLLDSQKLADAEAPKDPSGPSDPGTPGTPGGPSDPGTPPTGGGDDEDDLPASGSSGCDVTGFAPLAALLALGLAKARKPRG